MTVLLHELHVLFCVLETTKETPALCVSENKLAAELQVAIISACFGYILSTCSFPLLCPIAPLIQSRSMMRSFYK